MGIEFGRLLSFVWGLGDMCLYALCLAISGLVNCFFKYGISCFLWYQLLSMVSIAFNYVLLMVLLNYGIA